ncbi:hypothetical protein TYRP_009224 [Tyrophagus putrescentiae]|nr:hypothetical protein TYRP_009224 [Tyrophagus putrescentiae]
MPPPLLLLIAPVRALCFGGEDHQNDHGLALTLAPIGWHPRPHSGLKIITTTIIIITTTRAPVSMLVLFIFLSFFLSFPFSAATHGHHRRRGEEAGNRTVALPKRQIDTGGRSAEKVGNTSHKWCAASAWRVSIGLSSLHICWVIKRPGPSRYYCPSSDVGGPKRTVDKDGRLSEDGEADGFTNRNKVLG